MYFIELIVKQFKKKKEKQSYNPVLTNDLPQTEENTCEHNFMPIDSTGETLSCINCGLVVKKSDMKSKNFFINPKYH